jgi:hypothetical protein
MKGGQSPGRQLRVAVVVDAGVGERLANFLDGSLDAQGVEDEDFGDLGHVPAATGKQAVEEVLGPALLVANRGSSGERDL